MILQPKSPTEVLANRITHANGVTWVFHDLATGFVHHVNVPLVAQQQPSQRTAQSSHGNEMVLYQSPSNQSSQQVAQSASAAQPMATPNVQPESATLPITLPAPQAASAGGVNGKAADAGWTSGEVIGCAADAVCLACRGG